MRSEYERSDFTRLKRGTFYPAVAAGTCVVFLEPAIAKAFPTSKAVNEALANLLVLTEQTKRITRRSPRIRRKATRTA
jgi:hypothetical protein